MASDKLGVKLRKAYTQFVITILILSILFVTGSWELQNATAASLDHTIGNIDIIGLTDYGRLCEEPVYWNGVKQTATWSSGEPYQGLVFDHSLYDHSGGDYYIADWFDSYERQIFPDFKATGQDTSLRFEEDSPSQQKSVGSFTQVDSAGEIGVSYDARVHQSVWTLSGKDWAIVEWRIENLMAVSLNQVNIGMEVYSTAANVNRGGVDGDGADDLDFWDAADDTYYVQDQTMATIGYASADTSNPLDHYYGSETYFFDVDKDAYQALTGTDQLARNEAQFVLGDAIYSLVSWNGRTIAPNSQVAFAVVVACGADYSSLSSAISEAQDFWDSTRLKLTEVQDSPDTSERIEFYNSGSSSINVAGYYLSPDRGTTRWDLSSLGTINSGSYEVYNLFSALDELGNEGGEIGLYSADNYLLNKLGYGTGGVTPDPLSGESSALHHSGIQYSDIWNRETSPTFGSQNTVQGAQTSPKVVLNEVLFNPQSRETFIELKYIGLGVSVNLLAWKIVVDVEYTIGDVTLSPTFQFLVINSSMAPGLLATLTPSGDNVYLYNSTGEFVDMVGWNSEHQQDTSVMREPEGEGDHDGYNDTSSITAGWQFSSSPSMALVSIGIDQEKAADLGGTMTFYLNISNGGPTADVVDLNYTSLIEGMPGWWTIELYYDDGTWTSLTDTDGDFLVDIGSLDSFDTITIIVNVTVPSSLPIGGINEITIEVFSSVNPWAYDTVSLWAMAYPHIEALKSVYHNSIYLEGGGTFGFIPDETTLTITLKGLGGIPGTNISQDVIFCMDRSSSMLSSDPTGERKAGARYYTDLISFPARAGVVEFNETSRMLLGLSDDHDAVKAAINLIGQDGLTDMSLGLLLSIDELINNGNHRHNRVIILLTDGMNNYPWQDDATLDQAQRAADEGIIIFTIGLGDDADDALLTQVAAITGGVYYFTPTPDNLMAIFGYIAEELIVIAGEDPDPDISPLLTDVLPPYIDYIPGSFVNPYTGDPMDPSKITVDGNSNTILEWNITQIAIGEIWAVSFNITASEIGLKETNVYGISSINYTRYTDLNNTVFTNDSLPRVWINVLPIPPLPPTLYCNLTADKSNVWLNWTDPPTATDHYLIYRSEDKQEFDFSVPWKDTSLDINPITGIIDPLNRNWLDSGAALSSAPSQYYYCVRSVEASGNFSTTSNTVGKWTKSFITGVGTFSLPLEPFEVKEVDWFCDDIPNVDYIKWRDPSTQTWVTHYKSDSLGVNDTLVVLEEGYEIMLNAQTYYTFTGRPGTSIRYLEDFIPAPTGFALDVGPWAETVRSSNFGPSSDWTKSVALGDVNNDGILDCVAGNFFDQNVVYLGDGKGNFNEFHIFGSGMGASASIALADVNSDSDLDIIVGNQFNGMSGQNVVYLGDGDGTFDTTSYNFGTGSDATESIALGYIDSDSNLDIVVGNQFNMFDCQNVVYLGDGDGTFDTTGRPGLCRFRFIP
jgi:hypothetical protein